MLYAKSNGIELHRHMFDVGLLCQAIGDEVLKRELDLVYRIHMLRKLVLAGMLHDIGKAHSNFQKKLTDASGDEILGKNKFRHNEIGWAFLSKYYNPNMKEFSDIINDAVYWHHGISNTMGSARSGEILEDITDEDIQNMKDILAKVLSGTDSIAKEELPDVKAPIYYSDQDLWLNTERSFARACVCSSDRIASKLYDIGSYQQCLDVIRGITKRVGTLKVDNNPYDDNERFKYQVDIVDKAGQTTLVKGPAGFGKTLAAIMWAAKSDKKLIWVCPRNSVAYSVYESVCNELKNTGNDNISVELYLTGEVKKTNTSNYSGFDSDIIVTNIDNFISPTINYKHSDERLFLINAADVVFDEFHELIGDSALFAAFVTLVNVRHRLTNSRTLLLSATPSIICTKFWNSPDNKVVILPSEDKHYPAAHNQTYNIRVLENEPSPTGGDLIVYNTIFSAQASSTRNKNTQLIHSKYTDEDKAFRYERLISQYGKKGSNNGKPVVGSHVVQASLDVSFKNVSECVLSPESTLQRIGRCNRWGDMGDGSNINLFTRDDRGENNIIREMYTPELNLLWLEELKMLNGIEVTLDELYTLYNSFHVKYKDKISRYINNVFNNSMDNLSTIYPIKFTGVKSDDGVQTAGGNKLRISTNSLFYICKKYNNDEWVGPFTANIHRNVGEEFGEGNISNPTTKIKRVMESLVSDERFDYAKILKKPSKYLTLDNFRLHAKKSNTPYIRFNEVYHPELGLISTDRMSMLVNN